MICRPDRGRPLPTIKRMSVTEFRRLGFLQEVNRLLLHPCGLALEVVVDEDGIERFGGVWDYRHDPVGVEFGPRMIDPERIDSVWREWKRHVEARIAHGHRAEIARGGVQDQ